LKNDNTRRIRSFTLLELLIVVAIISILVAITIPRFLNAQIRANIARSVSDIHALISAQELYRADHNGYAPYGIVTSSLKTVPSSVLSWLTTPVSYISSVPEDPFLKGFPYSFGYAHELIVSPRSSIVAYSLSSSGPSKIHIKVCFWFQPPIFFSDQAYLTYDATNGLYSKGGIVFWGGDSTNIHVLFDDKFFAGRFPPNHGQH
jgi:type II secretion system protein G